LAYVTGLSIRKLLLQNGYLIAETGIQIVAEILRVTRPDGHLGHLLDNRQSIIPPPALPSTAGSKAIR
jgi:hypothetical protein